MADDDWRPVASWDILQQRGHLMRRIRDFFWQRQVWEVETPQRLSSVAPELHQDPIPCQAGFLQPSPETAMKRLLAAGMGPIYQICHAFRADECGSLHNPEFSILEWYQPGWSDRALMVEVEALLWTVLADSHPGHKPAQVMRFTEAFQKFAGVDPLLASDAALAMACQGRAHHGTETLDRADLLDLIVIQRVEPGLKAMGGAIFLVDFPPSVAAMARIDPGPPAVARRFELYFNGIELANGYQELTDPDEQRMRLGEINKQRQLRGKPPLPVDEKFLRALDHGLPECSGVALGLDRLMMLALGAKTIQAVMTFPGDRI